MLPGDDNASELRHATDMTPHRSFRQIRRPSVTINETRETGLI